MRGAGITYDKGYESAMTCVYRPPRFGLHLIQDLSFSVVTLEPAMCARIGKPASRALRQISAALARTTRPGCRQDPRSGSVYLPVRSPGRFENARRASSVREYARPSP